LSGRRKTSVFELAGVYRAYIRAGSALGAGIFVDDVLVVSLFDAGYGAFGFASSAADAFV
jgi:hypothetical protein